MDLRPDSVITLITDFGTQDGFAGAMKGALRRLCPSTRVIDLSHDIPPQDIITAAHCAAKAIPQFQHNDIHVVVVDPGVGSERAALLIASDWGWLVGPDNGVFDRLYKLSTRWKAYSLADQCDAWSKHQSFDGLYLFAPAAAFVHQHGLPHDWVTSFEYKVRLSHSSSPKIDYFDHFGNAYVGYMPDKTPSAAWANGTRFVRVDHYSDVPNGLPLMLKNSDQLWELSINGGSAKTALGLKIDMSVQFDY